MNSNNQSANSPDTYSQRLADIAGTAIALLTLILPVSVISYYSAPNLENDRQSGIDNSKQGQTLFGNKISVITKGYQSS